MKKIILSMAAAALFFTACQNNAPSEAVATSEAEQAPAASAAAVMLPVNVATSVIEWEGYKPGGSGHVGTIKLQGGDVALNNGTLEGGRFTIDMNSLACTDLQGSKKTDLEGHLKNADFFDVPKFPTGTFEITKVEAITPDSTGATHKLTGNLTLKGIVKSIQIPAKVTLTEGRLLAETPQFTINRTDWGVQYKSSVVNTIKDELIADDVKLKIKLEAAASAQ